MTSVPNGGLAVLQNVAAGRGAWHGWDAASGHIVDSQDCFAARSEIIQACRQRGLLTDANALTPQGAEIVRAVEAAHG